MKDSSNNIEVNNLHLSLTGNIAIDGISHVFDLSKNTGIIGETGSGKSSLLKLMAGLEQAEKGSVYYNDERVLGAGEKLIPGHPKIAYLSQHYELKNNYRIEEILSYYNLIQKEAASEIYKICEIDHLFHRWSDELSGGEKQRVAMASLLTQKPAVLLLDEPFSNLDCLHKNKLTGLLKNIQSATGVSFITVSHDIQDILSWSDEIIVMKSGKIIQSGPPEKLYHQPVDEYCAGLLGNYQLLESELEITKTITNGKYISGKRLLIRPGYFDFCKKEETNLIGVVKNSSFYGNYFLLEIGIGNTTLHVSTANNLYKKGEEVALSVKIEDFCFL